ncbi:MAG: acetyl-CoA carboxylase carboxyltransferase subunit alpha [Gammaproteobacteria bacterium]
MSLNYLDFEKPIAELQAKIDELRLVGSDAELNITEEIKRLEEKSKELTHSVFADLTDWQKVQLARHPLRPYTMDYIERVFTDFDELHGDKQTSSGFTIVAGTARLGGQPVMVMGQQKGRKTQEKVSRNFGMPKPEDYRKTQRLFEMAERFKLPIISLIDTPGAYPGIDAESRNQSEAIARNLLMMAKLKTPVICTVIGEGGSGGALAIGVGDCVMMLQYSIYSVISPEGCASILWKNAEKASQAAEAMGVTADRVLSLKLIDKIIEEPLGGAHRDHDLMAQRLQQNLLEQLKRLQALPLDQLVERRYQRLMAYGLEG